MNTTVQALVFALASVAAATALGMSLADRAAQPQEIVALERVVIVGKRADPQATPLLAKLPRVVIEGRGAVPADVHVTAAKRMAKTI